MRIFRRESLIGNPTIKSIIRRSLEGDFPKFTIFSGESGVGKSSYAEICAMALTCENPTEDYEPCCECPSCKNAMASILQSNVGEYVKKYNLAQLANKGDLLELINKMFRIDYGSHNTVFILEEPQALMENFQTALLEELERIPDNVYIMLCTTKPNKLLPDIRNRAVKFKFNRLTPSDSRLLIAKIFEGFGLKVDQNVSNKILAHSNGVPREIVINTQYVIKNKIFDPKELDCLFNSVSNDSIRTLLKISTDSKAFINYLEELLTSNDVNDFLSSLKSYLMEMAFLSKDLSFRETALSSNDKSFAKELGGDLILQIYNKIYKLNSYNVDDVKFIMIVVGEMISKKLKPQLKSAGVEVESASATRRDRESKEAFNSSIVNSNSFKKIGSGGV